MQKFRRDGGSLCKYRYRGEFCAHALVAGRECIGEENCAAKFSSLSKSRRSDCSFESWQGLYCAKYQRFYCAGIENCSTAESYMAHFARYTQRLGMIR